MANLIMVTANNAARIVMSVDRAAKGVVKGGKVTEGLLNKLSKVQGNPNNPVHIGQIIRRFERQ